MVALVLTKIVEAICTIAIGRGFVSALALDTKVASIARRVIAIATDNLRVAQAITWILSGIIGLILLTIWLSFRIDERIYNVISPIPELGSLQFDSFDARLTRSITTGTMDVALVAKVVNKNTELLDMHATLYGSVNGKQFLGEDGKNYVDIDGYAGVDKPSLLILTFNDVPTDKSAQTLTISGEFKYDITYSFSPKGTRARRTMKIIEFVQKAPLKGVPGESKFPWTVIFKDEKEE
jgi:hypothetical protein